MSTLSVWLLFILIGLGTFLQRLSFIFLIGKVGMPEWSEADQTLARAVQA